MRNIRKILMRVIVAVFICSKVIAEQIVIKMGTLAPEGTSWIELAKEFSKHIENFSHGNVKFMWYAGGIMGDEPDMIRKIKFSQLHGGGFTGMGLGKVVPEVRGFELPLLFNTLEEVDYVLEKMFDFYKEMFRKKGFELLGWAENGFVYVFSKVELKNKSDLKNVKMWVWAGDDFAQKVFSSFGEISPIPMDITSVLMGLQTGMVNSFYNTPIAALALQWYKETKYFIDIPISYSASALVISSTVWEKIPDDVKKEIEKKGKELIDKMKKIAREDNKKATEEMFRSGIQKIKPSEELINYFKQSVPVAYKELEGKFYTPDLLSKIKFYLEEYRKNTQLKSGGKK